MYDFLVVGCGLFGSVFARRVVEAGKSVLLIDSRNHIGGNVQTLDIESIPAHQYGPHLFHTESDRIWSYVNRFAEFNSYQHRVKANYKGKLFTLPFNLQTYYELWGITCPAEAKRHIASQVVQIEKPANLEEWALSKVGRDIYDTLIYGYTKKQWGREPRELPASILKRLPLRFTFNDNYFNDKHQGVPIKGYTHMVENIIDGLEVKLNVDFFSDANLAKLASKVVYSGPIDQLFGYRHGHLEYRTLRFEQKVMDGDFQGVGQMNYTHADVPFTRIVEHKHFHNIQSDKTVVTYEYPDEWAPGKTPYYPINDKKNDDLFARYREEALASDMIVGGRLGRYQYYNMDQVIANALSTAERELC